jgi:hypothetical protein
MILLPPPSAGQPWEKCSTVCFWKPVPRWRFLLVPLTRLMASLPAAGRPGDEETYTPLLLGRALNMYVLAHEVLESSGLTGLASDIANGLDTCNFFEVSY